MYPRHILFPYQRKSSENLLPFAALNLLSPVDYTPNYSNTLPFSPYFLMKFIICDLCVNKIVLSWPHVPLQTLPLYLWSPLHENFSRKPMNHSTPGLPVHHQLPESTQTHVHWVGDAVQPSHPLLFPSSPALNLSQHQGLFKWVSSSQLVNNTTRSVV